MIDERVLTMGNYCIVIQGCGPHHNDLSSDADQIAKDTVALLKEKGHTITHATVHHAGLDTITSHVNPEPFAYSIEGVVKTINRSWIKGIDVILSRGGVGDHKYGLFEDGDSTRIDAGTTLHLVRGVVRKFNLVPPATF